MNPSLTQMPPKAQSERALRVRSIVILGIGGCWANVAKLWDHKLVALRLGYPRVRPASLSLSLGVVSEFLLGISGVLGMSAFFWVSLWFLKVCRCL